jgi:hypothetical protein
LTGGNADRPPASHASIVKPRINQRIDEILDLAMRDRFAAVTAALRLRRWFDQQNPSGQPVPEREELLNELDDLIGILRNG